MAQSISSEIVVKLPLLQLWEAFKDLHQLLPRLLPGFLESSAIVSGNGGPGSIRELKFCSGNTNNVPGISTSIEEIEDINEDTHVYIYNVLESEILESFSSYRVTWKFEDQTNGPGTKVTWTADFIAVNGGERPERFRDSALLLLRQLEGHLLATGEYKQPSIMNKMRDDLLED